MGIFLNNVKRKYKEIRLEILVIVDNYCEIVRALFAHENDNEKGDD